MLVRIQDWAKVAHRFTQDDCGEFHLAVTGQSVCPSGLVLDEARIAPTLRARLTTALAEAAGEAAATPARG